MSLPVFIDGRVLCPRKIKSQGNPRQEIRRSLGTTDRDLAKRRLAKLKDDLPKIDPSKGRMTLVELCDQYLRTVQHQKAKTVERKELIARRIKEEWPGGANCAVSKVKPSDVQFWLAQYKFGEPSLWRFVTFARRQFRHPTHLFNRTHIILAWQLHFGTEGARQ